MKMLKLAALGAACLSLSSCFFAPGKFDSTLELRRDGRFSFAYTGEVLFFEGEQRKSQMMDDKCFGPVPGAERDNLVQDGPPPPVVRTIPVPRPGPDAEGQEDADADVVPPPVIASPDYEERACTPAEKAERAASRKRQEEQEAQMLAAVVGFDPSDPKSVAAYIAELKRHPGWRQVTHKGGNRFDVDYRISGAADRDFLFPVFDNVVVHTPFVTMRPRNDGTAEVRAPAFGGGGLGVLGALGGPLGPGARAQRDGDDPFSRMLKATGGTFTIVTDGDIRTNNTAEGPAARGTDKALTWKVTSLSKEAPRALIALR